MYGIFTYIGKIWLVREIIPFYGRKIQVSEV